MSETTTAYIGLGSNIDDRAGYIDSALAALGQSDGIKLGRVSRMVETTPLGQKVQPNYLNVVAEIKTSLDAAGFFRRLSDIEAALGRVRTEKWASRTIDLDLLLFGEQIINTSVLTVPHRQMHLRSFVLTALCELNSRLVHPVIRQPVSELAARLAGKDFVLNPDVPQLVCTAGVIGVGKTTLAKGLAEELDCKLILEAYDTNPFMPEVYAGKKELALDSQLYFLDSRVEQLKAGLLGLAEPAIADYIFEKEVIYAGRTLNNRQIVAYNKRHEAVVNSITKPVLAIYLQDTPQNCLQRVRKRNRPYEQQIELEFLRDLQNDYEDIFSGWKACPLIRISMSEFDCTSGGNVTRLANEIRSYIVVKQ